jgi:hypothetical protein
MSGQKATSFAVSPLPSITEAEDYVSKADRKKGIVAYNWNGFSWEGILDIYVGFYSGIVSTLTKMINDPKRTQEEIKNLRRDRTVIKQKLRRQLDFLNS